MGPILRANPGLAVGVAMSVAFPLVLALLSLILRAAGSSLRPIVFLAGLMLPLAVLFLVAALVTARKPGAADAATFSLPVTDGRFTDRAQLFGADLPAEHVRDARSVFPEFFAEAEHAELGLVGTGESTWVAQFPTADAAQRASSALWRFFAVTNTHGDEQRGWRGERGMNGDFFEMLRTGRHLFLWTAPSAETCAALRAASTIPGAPGLTQPARDPLIPSLQPLAAWFRPVGMKIGGTLLMVALSSVWFFKGAAWASRSPAVSGTSPVAATELAARLESVNALDVPYRVERGEVPGELFATWRHADAKWMDHARVHGLRRTFRIRLLLDEATHAVRATDHVAEFDGSVGRDGARIAWRTMTGIVFFQREQRRVLGLHLDEHGRFTKDLAHTFAFRLDEMKSPLIDAVTRAGWDWRPTLWQGPAWLRWLTE